MLLATKDKSPYGGKDIFVPNFTSLSMKDRNKVHHYAGRWTEHKDEGIAGLVVPIVGLLILGGMVFGMKMQNAIIVLSFFVLMAAPLIGGICYAVFVGVRGPQRPAIPIIEMDDVRWKMLLVAFGDDRKLWERLTEVLKNGSHLFGLGLYWDQRHETPLMRQLDDVLSTFVTSEHPTVEAARAVRADVERIFAKHDQEQQEASIARQAAREIEAASAQQLFDLNVQMARQDAESFVELPTIQLNEGV